MKKVKDFFDKKSKDIKFSTAGTGHKLSDPPRSGQPSTSKAANPAVPASASSSAEPYSNRRTGPDPNVAAAVLARFEGKGNATNVPPAKPTLHNIMEEEKRKAIEEIRQKEKEEALRKEQEKLRQIEERNPFKEFEDSQRFFCPQVGLEKESVSFKDLQCKIKTYIFTEIDDLTLRFAMVIFNSNYEIKEGRLDKARVDDCVNILKKIVKNLQTDDPDDFEKFSRIRISRIQAKVLDLEGGQNFLFAIGFTVDKDDPEFLIYDLQDEDVRAKMEMIYEILSAPNAFYKIKLDHQLKHITDEASNEHEGSSDDLRHTSADLRNFYSNLEKTREINEMLVSKETKLKLLSTSSKFKPNFGRLRFKFTLIDNESQTIEAVFFAAKTLNSVKKWFWKNFSELFGEKQIHFQLGPEKFTDEAMQQSLLELKLAPAATLIVMAK